MESSRDFDCTRDAFFQGQLTVFQPRDGYRFSLDSPILANFLPEISLGEALEIGTGCGIISLLGLALNRFPSVFSVEIQSRLCALARENANLNHFEKRMSVVCGDFLRINHQFKGISLAFSNPPFQPLGRGRLSPNAEIRDARFETRITLMQMMNALSPVLDDEGRFCLILPVEREKEMEDLVARAGYFIERRRHVLSFPHGKPTRFLVQLSRHRSTTVTEEPLIVFRSVGAYTPEMESILAGHDHDKQNS